MALTLAQASYLDPQFIVWYLHIDRIYSFVLEQLRISVFDVFLTCVGRGEGRVNCYDSWLGYLNRRDTVWYQGKDSFFIYRELFRYFIFCFPLNINKKEFISRYFQLTMEFFDVKWKKKLNKIEIKFILKEEIFIRGKTWFHDKYLPV